MVLQHWPTPCSMVRTGSNPIRFVNFGVGDMRKLKSVLCASFLAAAALVVPSVGQAALFNLTSDHCSGSGGCLGNNASLGTITVTSPSTGTLIFSIALSVPGSTIVN